MTNSRALDSLSTNCDIDIKASLKDKLLWSICEEQLRVRELTHLSFTNSYE
jgi:hypothetical protein